MGLRVFSVFFTLIIFIDPCTSGPDSCNQGIENKGSYPLTLHIENVVHTRLSGPFYFCLGLTKLNQGPIQAWLE